MNHIDELLDRYWAGESSLEEERALKAYFQSGNVAPKHQVFAPLFQAIGEEQQVTSQHTAKKLAMPDKPVMYSSLMRWTAAASVLAITALGLWWSLRETPLPQPVANVTPDAPVTAPDVPATPQYATTMPEQKQPDITPKLRKKFRKHQSPSQEAITDREARLAMEEVKAALALVSSKISKSRREAAKGAIHTEQLDRFFKKKDG